jgi:hypothetical protein
MKIICTSRPKKWQVHYRQQQMEKTALDKLYWKGSTADMQSARDMLREMSEELERFQESHPDCDWLPFETAASLGAPTSKDSFTLFLRLPPETRDAIWWNALGEQGPVIHCARELETTRNKAFISNQPIQHTCRETRFFYLSHTQAIFHFETYINFDRDIGSWEEGDQG